MPPSCSVLQARMMSKGQVSTVESLLGLGQQKSQQELARLNPSRPPELCWMALPSAWGQLRCLPHAWGTALAAADNQALVKKAQWAEGSSPVWADAAACQLLLKELLV